jgi:hypothetical protein
MESLWRLLALSTHNIFSICIGEEHLGQFILSTSDTTVSETIDLCEPGGHQAPAGRAITLKIALARSGGHFVVAVLAPQMLIDRIKEYSYRISMLRLQPHAILVKL